MAFFETAKLTVFIGCNYSKTNKWSSDKNVYILAVFVAWQTVKINYLSLLNLSSSILSYDLKTFNRLPDNVLCYICVPLK